MASVLVVIAYILHSSSGFVLHPSHSGVTKSQGIGKMFRASTLNMVDDSLPAAESSPTRRRRRKRKESADSTDDEQDSSAPVEEEAPPIELKARDDSPVQMQIMDIRDLVGGGSTSNASDGVSPTSSKQTEPTPSTTAGSSSSDDDTPNSSSSTGDSLQQLLEDAKLMQQQEETTSEEGVKIKATIGNALSTIVTADFFLVCAFLLWFLVGIFCSSFLKDDTIQIAFNSKYKALMCYFPGHGTGFMFLTIFCLSRLYHAANFQAFVQPALGILMIGSIAGNFFKEEEEDAEGL